MSKHHPNTLCKNCKNWAVGLWEFPCRACDNEGRQAHPFRDEKVKNYFKRAKGKPIYINDRLVDEKKREMGLVAND